MTNNDYQKFLDSLSKKLGVNSDTELKSALDKMSDQEIEAEYTKFKDSELTNAFEKGGKFKYLKCLREFKKGGKMKKCNCGSKMDESKVQKALFGAILGAAKGLGSAGSLIGKAGKIANTISKVSSVAKPLIGMLPSKQVGTVNPSDIPNAVTTTNPTTPGLFQRSIPAVQMEDGGELNPKLSKLKRLRKKQ